MVRGEELEDLAMQAADDAMMAVLAKLGRLSRREPLHHLGLQVRPARGGRPPASARLAGSRGRDRARGLGLVRRSTRARARGTRAVGAARGPASCDRGGPDATSARGVRRPGPERGPDRRARRAALDRPAGRSTRRSTTPGGGCARRLPSRVWRCREATREAEMSGETGVATRRSSGCSARGPRRSAASDASSSSTATSSSSSRARTPTLGVPGLAAHLDGCPACREEHESLRALLAADARGPLRPRAGPRRGEPPRRPRPSTRPPSRARGAPGLGRSPARAGARGRRQGSASSAARLAPRG